MHRRIIAGSAALSLLGASALTLPALADDTLPDSTPVVDTTDPIDPVNPTPTPPDTTPQTPPADNTPADTEADNTASNGETADPVNPQPTPPDTTPQTPPADNTPADTEADNTASNGETGQNPPQVLDPAAVTPVAPHTFAPGDRAPDGHVFVEPSDTGYVPVSTYRPGVHLARTGADDFGITLLAAATLALAGSATALIAQRKAQR